MAFLTSEMGLTGYRPTLTIGSEPSSIITSVAWPAKRRLSSPSVVVTRAQSDTADRTSYSALRSY